MLRSSQVTGLMLVESLVQYYGDSIYRLALALCDDSSQALPLSIEIFTSAVSQRHLFVGQSSLKAWLISIALKRATPLPEIESLILQLRYGHDLPVLEIASVLNTHPQQVVDCLRSYRSAASSSADQNCLSFRSQSEAEIDGWPESSDRAAWTDHLASCQDCRLYWYYLRQQENHLKKAYQDDHPAIQFDDQTRSLITSRVQARISQARKRFPFSLSVKEIVLISLLIIIVIAFAWSTNMFKAELDLNTVPVFYRTVVVTQLVTSLPGHTITAAPVQTFYYRVKPGDTLASIASGTGTTIELIASLNNLKVNSSISSGQLLILPDTASASAGFTMPTPVTPLSTPQALPAQADLISIRQRISESSNLWQTLWADVRLISYGPAGYIGPPVMDLHKQVWISKPSHSLVVSGSSRGNSGVLSYVDDGKNYLTDIGNDFVYQGPSVSLVDDIALRSLFFDPYLSESESLSGTVQSVVGYEVIANQNAIVLDWYNQRKSRQFRFWVDPVRGVILGQRRYGGPDGQTVLWDEFVTSIIFDTSFPLGFFERGSYSPLTFAQDYTGRPFVWSGPEPVPDWFPETGRSLLPENPPPPGFDPSQSTLTFQWPQLDSSSTAIKLFGDHYYLGEIKPVRPITQPGDWESLDVSNFIDWLGAPAPAQTQKYSTFPCKRSADGHLLVFASGTTGQLYWLDLLSPQQTNELAYSPACGFDFAIAPDSRHVAYIDQTGEMPGEMPCSVYLVDTVTNRSTKLLDIPFPDFIGGFYADSLTWSPDGSHLAVLLHSFVQTYEEVFVSAVSTGEIIYRKQLDTTNKNLPSDAPTIHWGVPFPPDPGSIRNCIEP